MTGTSAKVAAIRSSYAQVQSAAAGARSAHIDAGDTVIADVRVAHPAQMAALPDRVKTRLQEAEQRETEAVADLERIQSQLKAAQRELDLARRAVGRAVSNLA